MWNKVWLSTKQVSKNTQCCPKYRKLHKKFFKIAGNKAQSTIVNRAILIFFKWTSFSYNCLPQNLNESNCTKNRNVTWDNNDSSTTSTYLHIRFLNNIKMADMKEKRLELYAFTTSNIWYLYILYLYTVFIYCMSWAFEEKKYKHASHYFVLNLKSMP